MEKEKVKELVSVVTEEKDKQLIKDTAGLFTIMQNSEEIEETLIYAYGSGISMGIRTVIEMLENN